MGCSARLWAGVRRELDGVDSRVEELDEPDLDQCVEALLDRLPDRFALAGLSLGGIVAMAVVRTASERVTRLCLLDTNARPPTETQREAWASQIAILEAGESARSLQTRLLPALLHPDASPEVVEQTLLMADEVGEARFARQLRLQGTRVDERPGLSAVGVPTTVIVGAEDTLCPLDRHHEIRGLVPGSQLRVLPATGHLSALERPAEVAAMMREWMDS